MRESKGWPGIVKDAVQEGSPEGRSDFRENLEVWLDSQGWRKE